MKGATFLQSANLILVQTYKTSYVHTNLILVQIWNKTKQSQSSLISHVLKLQRWRINIHFNRPMVCRNPNIKLHELPEESPDQSNTTTNGKRFI
ncbi:hypothetical protein Hanom_Chr17g01532651 [Helianthus anomalus]